MQTMRTPAFDVTNPDILKMPYHLDSNTAEEFLEEAKLLILSGVIELVLDCSELNFITANGMHAILSLSQELNSAQGKLSIFGLNGEAKDMFEHCAFQEIIPTYSNQEEAIARMAA